MAAANKTPGLQAVFTTFTANTPQMFVDVDRVRAQMLDVPLQNVFDTLRIYLGSAYVNDFHAFGRTYRVTAQADAPYRIDQAKIAQLKVRSANGAMVPLGSLATFREISGPQRVPRYNLYPAIEMQGTTAPGVSSGEGIQIMSDLASRTRFYAARVNSGRRRDGKKGLQELRNRPIPAETGDDCFQSRQRKSRTPSNSMEVRVKARPLRIAAALGALAPRRLRCFFHGLNEIAEALPLDEDVRAYSLLGQSTIARENGVHDLLVFLERSLKPLTNPQLQAPVRTGAARHCPHLLDKKCVLARLVNGKMKLLVELEVSIGILRVAAGFMGSFDPLLLE